MGLIFLSLKSKSTLAFIACLLFSVFILDVSKAKKYGWKAKISLDRGFELTYKDFLKKNIT